MARPENTVEDHAGTDGTDMDLAASLADRKRLLAELGFLFGADIVEQADQVDIADLNLTDPVIESITAGVRRLKQLKHKPEAQLAMVRAMTAGESIVLCLWIMDMDLLDKIQDHSYLAMNGSV